MASTAAERKVDMGWPGAVPTWAVRVTVALAQAAALWLVARSPGVHRWPATDPAAFEAALLACLSGPTAAMLAVGKAGAARALAWGLAVSAAAAGLGWYDAGWSVPVPAATATYGIEAALPSLRLGVILPLALLVANAILMASLRAKKGRAPYSSYYDAAWKQGIQVAAAFTFAAALWGVLWLGALLFMAVGIEAVRKLLSDDWFAYPATTLAVATAIHATDVRPALFEGARSVVVAPLSWLLPVLATVCAAFLACLPFTGLEALREAHAASYTLLSASVGLLALLNAWSRDGSDESTRADTALTWAATACMAALALLAAHGIGVRVAEYGWTPERVLAAAAGTMALAYSAGYLLALWPRLGTDAFRATNVACAWLAVALGLALCTPVADPGRISAADQVARLSAGTTAAGAFDMDALGWGMGRWGRVALAGLARDSKDAPTRDAANVVLAQPRRGRMATRASAAARPEDPGPRVSMLPEGTQPPGTMDTEWFRSAGGPLPGCATPYGHRCQARFADLGRGADDLVVTDGTTVNLYERSAAGAWSAIGTSALPGPCRVAEDALSGAVTGVAHAVPDLVVGGRTVTMVPVGGCP